MARKSKTKEPPQPITAPTQAYLKVLEHLKEEHNLRSIPSDLSAERVDLLSNDYLGLGAEAHIYRKEFEERFPDAQMTSSASRLLSRRNRYHNRLEEYLGELYGRRALLFNSGYHANVGIIQALAIPGTLFLADKLVHASIIDGLRLCGADFKRYPHNDMRNLKRLIKENYKEYERIIVITEGIFSMDGDMAPINQLVELKRQYPKVMLYLDEAHSFGVRGMQGLGVAEETGHIPDIDIIIGTLGKAAASAGAFAITSAEMKQYLINTARSFIFSTALSPAQAAWSILMIEKLVAMNDRRLHLQRLSKYIVRELSRRLNFESPAITQIVPLIIGDASEAVLMSNYLAQNGFDSLAIRKPTVPAGSERLRFSLNALLTEKDIDRLITALSHYP
ncbi:MAG: 8-amino-7-oxononanoate synthase [Muribaculaceae bacterium]|nr:8-amino-7-oxononanoate synthase [Muribaculaceae bacterium]